MSKTLFAAGALAFGALAVCPLCGGGPDAVSATHVVALETPADTAQVRLAIQGMTCGSCATTARLALRRVAGVYDATVSYDSASAVVKYDPAATAPDRFIAELARMTGYVARVVVDTSGFPGGD